VVPVTPAPQGVVQVHPGVGPGMMPRVCTRYRFSALFALRVLGAVCTGVGLVVVALVVAAAVVSPGPVPDGVLVAVAVLAAVTIVGLALLVLRRPVVVTFDESGYRVRLVRGSGVRQASWTDVEDASAEVVAGERCIVVRLHDGRTTTVPVGVLEGRPDDFVHDLQRHLDAGHGYRRVSPGG
jgi:hypothetical protein